VVPVLNKIDLPSAEPDRVIEEIEDIIGIPAHDALRCSAKTGAGSTTFSRRSSRAFPRRRVIPQRRCRRSSSTRGSTTTSAS